MFSGESLVNRIRLGLKLILIGAVSGRYFYMRKLKFIQINIYKGKYLDALVDFLKQEDPDIVAMQEVTRGDVSYCSDKTVNIFEYVKAKTGFDGCFGSNQKFADSEKSLLGNAVLSKLPITGSKVLSLKEFRPVTLFEFEDSSIFPYLARLAIDVIIDVDGRTVHAISWHAAWTAPPADTTETLRQAKIVADYLKSLNNPFILGGDLNNIPESKTVGLISSVANNLMTGSNVVQTTHPKIHKIVPRGYLVDFIFTSGGIKAKSLKVPQVTVSDHLPVIAEVELIN